MRGEAGGKEINDNRESEYTQVWRKIFETRENK